MTRLKAIRLIRSGQRLIHLFTKEVGVAHPLEVWINHQNICDFSRRKQPQHQSIGPIHVRFWETTNVHWIHISPKQLLGFIRRNFSRK